MVFHLLPEQLTKEYEGEQSMPQLIQPQIEHQTLENQNNNFNFQPQPTFQPQPSNQPQPSFEPQPSSQQLDFKQKVETLTNRFHENYQNLQKQQNQQQLQIVYDKYLQDYSKFFYLDCFFLFFCLSLH